MIEKMEKEEEEEERMEEKEFLGKVKAACLEREEGLTCIFTCCAGDILNVQINNIKSHTSSNIFPRIKTGKSSPS